MRRRLTLAGRVCLVAAACWGAVASVATSPLHAYSPEKAGFAIRVRGETIPYRVFAVFALPGEVLKVAAANTPADSPPGQEIVVTSTGIEALRVGPRSWTWTAPAEAGLTVLQVRQRDGADQITLNVFTMAPAAAVRDGLLNGYRIGAYPDKPFRNLLAYRPPAGFVEVTAANLDTRLSPHFTLKQFLCKQSGGYPKYVALRERLLLKLEYLLALVNEKGHPAETLAVLSGFRTPSYNRAIGNVPNSRHLWGGAADVFVDENPKDGRMDDLNGDGRIDVGDARHLYQLFERVSGSAEHAEFTGGLGVYGTTSNHGPFVHVDARGYRARWGKL